MIDHLLQFVASITVCPSDIRKLQNHIELAAPIKDPLENVLITPLFVESGSLDLTRKMAEQGKHVVFDSGGYYVQMGRLRYEELYMPLLEMYKKHRWASRYTLPDHVPLSKDTPEIVQSKVRDTITYSTLFFQEMPDELKSRAMPVVQGHTFQQMDECLEAYIELGVKWIGFGSFGTQGSNNEVNIVTQNAIELARHVIKVAHANNIKVHLFGLGVPALVAMLKGVRADSFDSSSWLKAAGFGQVFLPFMRAYNISHNATVSDYQQGIGFEQFVSWCELTHHKCALCDDLLSLQTRKMYRATHNLIVINETVDMANNGELSHIQSIYKSGSPRYRGEYEKWML